MKSITENLKLIRLLWIIGIVAGVCGLMAQYISGETLNHSIVWPITAGLLLCVIPKRRINLEARDASDLLKGASSVDQLPISWSLLMGCVLFFAYGGDSPKAMFLIAIAIICLLVLSLFGKKPILNGALMCLFAFVLWKVLYLVELGFIPPLPIMPSLKPMAIYATIFGLIAITMAIIYFKALQNYVFIVMLIDGIFSVAVFSEHVSWVFYAGVIEVLLVAIFWAGFNPWNIEWD